MVLGTIVGADSTSGSSESSKAKNNLHWSGRAYTQNDNWHYLSSIWGTSYNLLNSNLSRNTSRAYFRGR